MLALKQFNKMLINLIRNQWIIIKGQEALLYTLSNKEDIAIRKFENKERKKFNRDAGPYKSAFVDVIVKDLNTED